MSERLSGRRAEAERNHVRILDAAREVFLADPSAPMAAVAKRAGVGISALYLRYADKEDLLRTVTAEGLRAFADDLTAALDDEGDPWHVYSLALGRLVANGSQALAGRLAGSFTPNRQLDDLARKSGNLFAAVHERARAAGVLRTDVTTADVTLLLEMVMAAPAHHRARYLGLILQSLHAPGAGPLPGPPAENAELAARWKAR